MIQNISWGQFLIFYGVLLLLYYMCVLLKYYQQDIVRIFKSRFRMSKPGGASSIHFTEEQFAHTFEQLEEISHDIRYKIIPVCGNSAERLLEELGQRLGHFRGVHVPAFKRILITKILMACGEKGLILSEQELVKWWAGLR